MNDRNKLICILTKIVPLPYKTITAIADKLTESGVTIQKWIPVADRLPEGDNFLAATYDGLVGEAFMMEKEFYWQEDAADWDDAEPITDRVTHWMSLPEVPKGE